MNTLQFSAMLNTLEHIGPWEITGRINNGAFGIVFSAQRRRVDRSVQTAAIKLITPEGMNNAEYRSMFVHEFQVLQGLRSKYIPSVIDSGIEQVSVGDRSVDLQWFAMDEIRGDNLSTEVQRLGPLEEHLWIELAHDLLSAVAVTHANRLIHQDIKPDNVMRFSRHSVLVDYGGASFVHIEDPGDVGVYTLGFCAPEQIADGVVPSEHEYALDLFAVGATLAFAGTNVMPWEVPNPEDGVTNEREAHLSVRRQLHERLTTTKPNLFGLRPEIQSFLERLVDANPKNRGTAEEALQAIKEMLPEGTPRKTEVISDADRNVFVGADTRVATPDEVSRLFQTAFTAETGATSSRGSETLTYSIARPEDPNGKQYFDITVGELLTTMDAPFSVRKGTTKHTEQILEWSSPWGIVVSNDVVNLRTTLLTSSVFGGEDFSDGFRLLLQSLLRDARILESAVQELMAGKIKTLADAVVPEVAADVAIPRPSVGLSKKSGGGLSVSTSTSGPGSDSSDALTPKGGLNKRL
jgi:serine/threonine protein kinase